MIARKERECVAALAGLGGFVGDIRQSSDCGYFNSEDHPEPGEGFYLEARRTLAAWLEVDDDEGVWNKAYDFLAKEASHD